MLNLTKQFAVILNYISGGMLMSQITWMKEAKCFKMGIMNRFWYEFGRQE